MYTFEVVDRDTKEPIVNERTVLYRSTIDILLERWATLNAEGRREFVKQVHESDKASINGKRGVVKVTHIPDDASRLPEIYDHDYIDKIPVGEDIYLLTYRDGVVRLLHICRRNRDGCSHVSAEQRRPPNCE